MDLIHNRRPYGCTYRGCERTFRNPQTMRMHHRTHFSSADKAAGGGGAVPVPVPVPVAVLEGSPVKAGHNKKIPSRCPSCDKTFVGLYELRRHFGRKHSEGEKRHACHKCAKRYASKNPSLIPRQWQSFRRKCHFQVGQNSLKSGHFGLKLSKDIREIR